MGGGTRIATHRHADPASSVGVVNATSGVGIAPRFISDFSTGNHSGRIRLAVGQILLLDDGGHRGGIRRTQALAVS
jgi:hypothetical protein